MQIADDLKAKNDVELEQWYLEALTAEPLPVDVMMAVLVRQYERNDTTVAPQWAEMLQDVLVERGMRRELLGLLTLRTTREDERDGWRARCGGDCSRAFADRLGQIYVKNAGFDRDLPASECVRRLAVLDGLAPGVFCLDRTWGFGVVARVDDFYQKVQIDFDGKPGHAMSFAYAAEALRLLAADHFLARTHADPAGMRELARTDPAAIVRLVLASFGPLPVLDIHDRVVGRVIDEAQWKGFWDGARRVLKQDPCVEIPARRSEPVVIHARAKAIDEAWFAALGRQRDMATVLGLVGEMEAAGALPADPRLREIVRERLAFVVRGAEGRHPEMVTLALLAAQRLELARPGDEFDRAADGLMSPEVLLRGLNSLPARDVDAALAFLRTRRPEESDDLLLSLIPDLKTSVAAAIVDMIAAAGRPELCGARLGEMLRDRTGGPVVIHWLCRNLDRIAEWSIASIPELLTELIETLREDAAGEILRAQNQLRQLLEKDEWLQAVFGQLAPALQEHFVERILKADGLLPDEQRSVLARLVKLFPELREAAAGGGSRSRETAPRWTAWRSFRQRQDQLRELVEITIPANSRDIAQARSYGDLRENFEYQAAKDQQRLLMRRQHEMERDLREVKGTDFEGASLDAVGMGTRVVLVRADGSEASFAVLGEWDRDEALGIISSTSKLGEALAGHRAGDEVAVPGVAGEEKVRILSIERLPDAVRQWIASTVPRAAAAT